jgi:hypothetical protein
MSERIKVVIDRAKWRTGGAAGGEGAGARMAQFGSTQLRNKEGFQCCLGFIVAQTRPEIPILGIEDPENCGCIIEGLTYEVAGWPQNTNLTMDAIKINDESTLTNAQREQQLLELFKDSLYELEFVGEYHVRKD